MPKKPLKKKTPLNAQDLIKRDQESRARIAFRWAGFGRVTGIAGKNFVFNGTECDVDDLFIYENVVVLVEYTVLTGGVSDHLKKKKVFFDKVLDDPAGFVEFLAGNFPKFAAAQNALYGKEHYRVVICYASRYAFSTATKAEVPGVAYLDYNVIRYLESVSRTVRASGRFEILSFLGLSTEDVGEGVITAHAGTTSFDGSVLPESHSNFGPGFKVISCYMSPEALLARAYVLRRDGWRAGANLYQRMISRSKVQGIRKYLREKKRVFINNIILTLNEDTKLLKPDGTTEDVSKITKTTPTKIQVTNEHSSIGIIDGQHRVFAYHEGGRDDADIAILRKRQNLLVTGVIFPANISVDERARFEANLFLEINSTQTNAKSDLKQEIELLLAPFSAVAIAKRVMNHINDEHGPLNNEFERYFYDDDKLKTTSVVSYALQHLVRPGGPDSLFAGWPHADKADILGKKNDALLAEYVQYAASEINIFVSAVKSRIPAQRWTADRKIKDRFLTTTHINGCLSCLRRLVRAKKLQPYAGYAAALTGLGAFDFSVYKSSQYNKLGEALQKAYFP